MTRTKFSFLVAAASTLVLTAHGANAASLNPAGALKEDAAGSSLVLQTHGCHKLCAPGPYGSTYWHRHKLFSCAPRQCVDWGSLWEPLFFKQRRSH
jgi:hypothetical protein